MKALIAIVVVSFSLQSFAYEDMSLGFTPSVTSSMLGALKEADQIILDVKDYRLTGKASAVLAKQIRNVQRANKVSKEEAIDMLLEMAQEQLSFNY
jgi:hypothetical protein